MTTWVSAPSNYGGSFGGNNTYALSKARWYMVHDALVGAGLVQTADTGQLDFETVSWGTGNSVMYGYRMYRFNDSRQGVDPIFIKVQYGNGWNGSRKSGFQYQVGQGTNGAGTLTGQLSTNAWLSGNLPDSTGDFTYQVYACHVDGFFGIMIAPGNLPYGVPIGYCSIQRTRDLSYAFDGTGIMIHDDNADARGCGNAQFVRFGANAFTGVRSTHFCIAPMLRASTALANGDKQLFPWFFADPSIRQAWATFTVRGNEIAGSMTTFTASPYAGQARTFIYPGLGKSPRSESANTQTTWEMAMLWE